MPQSSEALRDLMRCWFGDILDYGPMWLLESRGWTLNRGGLYSPPTSSYYNEIDWLCLQFLIEEWDYDIDRTAIHRYVKR